MNKSLPLKFYFPKVRRIQVIGHSEKASVFYQRIRKIIDHSCEVILTDKPDPDCEFSFVVDIPFPPFSDVPINLPAYISEETCYGFTSSQQFLNTTDWVAIRNIERQLLAMHSSGFWPLPDDVLSIMESRERSRKEVDREIQDSLNERNNLPV